MGYSFLERTVGKTAARELPTVLLRAPPHSRQASKLLGKWQSEASGKARGKSPDLQLEFFADGSVVENQNVFGKWSQLAIGTF